MDWKNIYENSREGFTTFSYDELHITCEQVGESSYRLFDELEQVELAVIGIGDPMYKERELIFDGSLVLDYWNITDVYEVLENKYPQTIFWIPGDMRKFSAFFMIPGFAECYMNNILILNSIEITELFFKEYKEFYLPKTVIAKKSDRLGHEMLERLHRERISDNSDRERNVFLSICIPTYNRGDKAIRALEPLLALPYDEEIEIIVADNGSEQTVDFYERIGGIKDSRLRYIRNDSNLGFHGNIMKLTRIAKGKYIVFQSDEDILIGKNLGKYLDCLMRYPNVSFVRPSGKGDNLIENQREGFIHYSVPKMSVALGTTYITTVMFRREHISDEILQKIQTLIDAENYFALYYPHSLLLFFASMFGDGYVCKTQLYQEGSSAPAEDGERTDDWWIKHYSIEVRASQLNDLFEIIVGCGMVSGDDIKELGMDQIWNTYRLVGVGLYHWGEIYYQMGETVQTIVSKMHLEVCGIIEKYKEIISDSIYLAWKEKNDACLDEWMTILKNDPRIGG